jgi:hypothetical protein
LFARAGPPRSCMWSLRPNGPHFASDGALTTSVNQILLELGPANLTEMIAHAETAGVSTTGLQGFLENHFYMPH